MTAVIMLVSAQETAKEPLYDKPFPFSKFKENLPIYFCVRGYLICLCFINNVFFQITLGSRGR